MSGKLIGIKPVYTIILILLTLSGFGQMPIFKRYYIADIPGLGWLAQFYVTHQIHYLAAAALIFMVFYVCMDFILNKKNRITRTGILGAGMVIGLMVSGAFMVIKNLDGIYWNHGVIIGLDLVHLLFCMGLLGVSVYGLIKRAP